MVKPEYAKVLEKYEEDLKVQIVPQVTTGVDVRKIYGIKHAPVNKRKIAYINLSKSAYELHKEPFVPRFNVPAIILGTIFNNEKWEHLLILTQNTTPAKLAAFDVLFIPGSTYSILDDIPQIKAFTHNMRIAL